jgi:hypothetical protein
MGSKNMPDILDFVDSGVKFRGKEIPSTFDKLYGSLP